MYTGFASTTDTYVALMALSEFSRKLRIVERGSDINLQYSFESTVRRMEIKADSSTLLQRRILVPETKEIQLRASGGGIGLVQVAYQFNIAVNGAWYFIFLNFSCIICTDIPNHFVHCPFCFFTSFYNGKQIV